MFDSSSVWFLCLLVIVPVIGWQWIRSAHRAAVRFSMADAAGRMESTWRQRTRWLLTTLRLLSLCLLIVALARPREGLTQRLAETEGIAIQLVIDRSGSMDHDDFQLKGEWVTRLEAVKSVAVRFINGDDVLSGRTSDMVGLVTFAKFAETRSPATLDHHSLLAHLEQTHVVDAFREDGTAIGDGLGLAVANLWELERQRQPTDSDQPLGKVVILLTDGESNAGELEPLEAAALAEEFGVRVYAIAVQPAKSSSQTTSAEPDDPAATLQQIADQTGGKFFVAGDVESLEAIYTEIDELERTPFAERRYTDYREWAIEPFRWGPFAFPALGVAALLLLFVEMTGQRTIYRQFP